MTTIISKKHPLKFYGSLAFGFLFLAGLGTLLLFVSIDLLQKDQPRTKDYFLPVFSFALYFFAFAILYAYWKNSPKITLDKYSIKIGNETFYLKDIKAIALTGKMPFKLIINFPMEGTAILFNNGTEKILFDDMYSNSPEIKLFLENVVVKKQDVIIDLKNEIDKNAIRFENEETFKGNQFTSLRGISLWGLIGFFAFMLLIKGQSSSIGLLVFFVVLGTFWFIIHSWLMHYFTLTNDYLVVKNHNFTWMAKVYRLMDIKEVVFETQGRQPNCMRIITKDFKNKLYPAGTLRDSVWLEMKRQLESKGVTVRNECI